MKKLFIIAFFLGCVSFLFAQQTPVSSQYFNNEIAYNPAVAGSKFYNPFVIMMRQQWLGFEGSPLTTNISYHGALNNRSGIGGSIYHDRTGPSTNSSLEFDYAYHIPLNKEKVNLSFGIGAKAMYYTLNLDEETLPPGEDPAFSASAFSQFLADASSGLFLYGRNFYLGYSVANMIQSKFNKEEGDGFSTNHLQRNYFGMLGYRYEFNRDIHIEPSILFRKAENTKSEYDFTARIFFQDFFWLGTTARTNGSASALIGFKAGEKYIAYTYDHYFREITSYQFGTHEISISFKVPSMLSQRHISFWSY